MLEFKYRNYFGNQDDILGFNNLFSFGGGIEFYLSRYLNVTQRIRLMARVRLGEKVREYWVGLGISF